MQRSPVVLSAAKDRLPQPGPGRARDSAAGVCPWQGVPAVTKACAKPYHGGGHGRVEGAQDGQTGYHGTGAARGSARDTRAAPGAARCAGAAGAAGSGERLLRTLLLATANPGKIREFARLLAGLPVRVIGLADAGVVSPEETGSTFVENAVLKAAHAANASGLLAVADDSGLEVDCLGGVPGVRSARYAGPAADDEANRRRLIGELERCIALDPRLAGGAPARFRCAIAVALPGGPVEVVEGAREGRAIVTPRGANGFGYDPLFLLPERGLTMAELSSAEKNATSHRARAVARALPVVRALLDTRPDRAAAANAPAGRGTGAGDGGRDAD